MNIEAFNDNSEIGAPFITEGFADGDCGDYSVTGCPVDDGKCTIMNNTCVSPMDSPGSESGDNGMANGATPGNGDGMDNEDGMGMGNGATPDNGDGMGGDGTQCSIGDKNGIMVGGVCKTVDPYTNYEGFQDDDLGNNVNVVNNQDNHQNNQLINVDLLLRSLVYGCLFYILSHPESVNMVRKVVGKLSNDNMLLVQMAIFVIVYYIFSIFI